jgi:hypothetical protein
MPSNISIVLPARIVFAPAMRVARELFDLRVRPSPAPLALRPFDDAVPTVPGPPVDRGPPHAVHCRLTFHHRGTIALLKSPGTNCCKSTLDVLRNEILLRHRYRRADQQATRYMCAPPGTQLQTIVCLPQVFNSLNRVTEKSRTNKQRIIVQLANRRFIVCVQSMRSLECVAPELLPLASVTWGTE